jgi:hypothetical protein
MVNDRPTIFFRVNINEAVNAVASRNDGETGVAEI